jgi:alkylation response protein AidB-like acyl-CoA dehydrogenase
MSILDGYCELEPRAPRDNFHMILTDTQEQIRDSVRSFARAEIAPRAVEWEQAGAYPREIFKELADLGLMGMTAPVECGGAGADYVSYALALMELAAADGGLSTVVSVHNAPVIAAVLREANEGQREVWLPQLCSASIIGAFALTEADAGTDAAAIHTRARLDNADYVLNGSKQFITSGRLADLVLTFAVTDPTAGKKGLSAFLIPTDRPGYGVAKVESKLGQRASDTCSLTFDEVRIEPELRLGAEGDGYRIALSNLEIGRIGIAAQSVGMAQSALDIAIAYAKERFTFGHSIITHQAVGHRLADLAASLEAARQLVLHAAALKDANRPCLSEASMAKLVASETAEKVCSGSLQTLGGYGYLEDYRVAKIYRDVRVCQIYEGTSDVQRLVIARHL